MPEFFPRDVRELALRVFEGLDTPVSLKAALLLQNDEWDQLASMHVDPRCYTSPHRFRSDAIAANLLRKLQELPTSVDRSQVAIDGFWESERDCYRSNERLSPYLYGGLPEVGLVGELLSSARKRISQILGPAPKVLNGRFGPGATLEDRGRLTTVADKISSQPTLTSDSFPYLFQWAETAWARACASESRPVKFVRGNRFTTVPKDCTKDRGIAVEPSINVFYQLGLGRAIRGRLRQFGIDLNFGQDIHRQAAREASIRGHLATLDLSSASDSVCKNLVKLLLPYDWLSQLEMLRSPCTFVQGKQVFLEKFSSMGNGYTFELETLIFLGICWAVCDHLGLPVEIGSDLLVYGDDIIVPTQASDAVISSLRFFGFKTNLRKTFVDTSFRESCGGDFFLGVAVRPYFLKKLPRNPSDWIVIANSLFDLSSPSDEGEVSDRKFLRARAFALDQIPEPIRRCRGPRSLGDIVIHDRPEAGTWRWKDGIRWYRAYHPVPRHLPWAYFKPEVVLACAVYGTGDGLRGITPRNSVSGYRLGWVAYS